MKSLSIARECYRVWCPRNLGCQERALARVSSIKSPSHEANRLALTCRYSSAGARARGIEARHANVLELPRSSDWQEASIAGDIRIADIRALCSIRYSGLSFRFRRARLNSCFVETARALSVPIFGVSTLAFAVRPSLAGAT